MAASGARPLGILGDLLCEDLNDACCWACSGGGDVVCCDGCKAVYHLPCIGLKQLPEDDWFCPLCHCKECNQPSRLHDDVRHISTKHLPVQIKSLQPRQSSEQRLPTGPGYLCPQQVRQWLTRELPGTADEPASSAQHIVANKAEANAAVDVQKSKRHKLDACSSSGSISPGGSSSSGLVRCCCCQQACHVVCLPTGLRHHYLRQTATAHTAQTSTKAVKADKASGQQKHRQVLLEPYFCSLSCQQVADHVAERCAQGLVQVDALTDGTPVCWQLIQPAAVAAALLPPPEAAAAAVAASFAGSPIKSPSKADSTPAKKQRGGKAAPEAPAVGLLGTGTAPAYSRAQAEVLAQVLRDVQQLMQQELGPAWEVRTFQDTLPWMLSGLRCDTPGGLLDLSHFHVATLWVGSTLSAAALVRLHGTAMLEVSQAATLEQLQHKQLGRLLVSCVERFALETCKVKQAWMPALGGVVKPCVGVSVLPSWERPASVREPLTLAGSRSSLELLGLRCEHNAPTAAPAGGSSGPQQQQLLMNTQQQTPKDLKSCWALQLRYGPAPSVVDWLQVPKHLLLRYSYVPFVTKRLRPETLVPLPRFRKQEQKAGPASAGGAAAGQQLTPGHAAGGGSVRTVVNAGAARVVTGASVGQKHTQHHDATRCTAEHTQCDQPQRLKQQVLTAPRAAANSSTQKPIAQVVICAAQGYSGWPHEQAAAMVCLEPQLHQLPPRKGQIKVLQEHMQQQQMVNQWRQLHSAAPLPLADAGHSTPATVEARIAAGIAAYGSVGSVVGVAGVHQQQQP